jgi:large subunit ribosomal protein L10
MIVGELKSNFQGTGSFIAVNYKGVSAQEANVLRMNLSEEEVGLKVIKNSLVSIAFKEIGILGLEQVIEGPLAITTSNGDPVAFAKALTKHSKEISGIKILGGLIDGRVSSHSDIDALAQLPSKDVVLTQILMGINTPLVQLANVFNATIKELCFVLLAIKEKKEA